MGETGCGKTKLIEFMSKLQVPTALKEEIETMIIVKVCDSKCFFIHLLFVIDLAFMVYYNGTAKCMLMFCRFMVGQLKKILSGKLKKVSNWLFRIRGFAKNTLPSLTQDKTRK